MKQHKNSSFFGISETTFGPIGLVWNTDGLVALQLPHSTDRASDMKKGLQARFADAEYSTELPTAIKKLAKKLTLHFEGKAQDFSDTPLALSTTPFFTKVYNYCLKRLPAGRTITYGELAAAVGRPKSARAIGMAMSKNPVPIVVPCHRVLAKSSQDPLRGFSAPGGTNTKQRILALEGVELK